ncbi:Double-stranded RNA-specific adenosine deaminase [Hondaea fermentalgiana]|uniref:Double-stranded RNA-specific adenosine deaminase n=1 Tax=Hondaea fermentalgiana TaxID=2315210 RepID=A0A2R5G8W6_9STRA|nr:Double-stranded RNA-specific adenosine deaminase [Hondaea fermentalgiana]|eukprot:GBG24501.1 Double-stranded RNA-specific adenosine deaminase [Hondaea fermentalgiana]
MSEPAKNERYAEKDRTATCAFADVVARAAREACEAQCPGFLDATLHSTEQTVLAAILLTHEAASPPQETQNEPKVLSLGIGTKFVRQYVKEADKVHGCRVHDAHAEVLARRAFLQVVMREIAKLHRDGTSDFLITDPETHRARLAPGAHLHLYTSSTPCGNSSVRRWASGKPEPPVPTDLAAHVWPQLPHGTMSLASRAEGQIAASVKRDLQTTEDEEEANHKAEDSTTESANGNEVATTTADAESVHMKKKKSKPSKSKPVFASGTAEPDSGQGNILSCSDKIAMWNLVGLQSKWLVDIVEPLYLSTLVVGRKFSRRHLERAMCCRLQEVPACGPYRLHHPVLLRTSVKLNSGNVAQDAEAAFSNNIAVHWARGDIDGASYLRGSKSRIEHLQESSSRVAATKLFARAFRCCRTYLRK